MHNRNLLFLFILIGFLFAGCNGIPNHTYDGNSAINFPKSVDSEPRFVVELYKDKDVIESLKVFDVSVNISTDELTMVLTSGEIRRYRGSFRYWPVE